MPRRRSWHRRRRTRRWLILSAIAATLLTSFVWAPPLWRHAQLLYWQRQCLNYTAPPDQVVYESDPTAAAKLLASSKACRTDASGAAYLVPEAWESFYSLLSPPGGRSQGTVFLHRLRRPDGVERLLAVDLIDADNPSMFHASIFQPGTAITRPRQVGNVMTMGMAIGGGDAFVFAATRPSKWRRVYAGRGDPADASHFTFVWESPFRRFMFDGWLLNDDRFVLETRESEGWLGITKYHMEGIPYVPFGPKIYLPPPPSTSPAP